MSSWTYLVCETPDPEGFDTALRAALADTRLSPERRDPREEAPGRVRYRFFLDRDAPDDAPPDGRWDLYLVDLVESGRIGAGSTGGDWHWVVVGRGNDTADAGRLVALDDDGRVDEYGGREGRVGHDGAAYLERVHGVLVDPTPDHYGEWRHLDLYDPRYDLPADASPDRRLATPQEPFEYAGHDRWLLVVAGHDRDRDGDRSRPDGDRERDRDRDRDDPVDLTAFGTAVEGRLDRADLPWTRESTDDGSVRVVAPQTLAVRESTRRWIETGPLRPGADHRPPWAVLVVGEGDRPTGAWAYEHNDRIAEVEFDDAAGDPGGIDDSDGGDDPDPVASAAARLRREFGVDVDPVPAPGSVPAPSRSGGD